MESRPYWSPGGHAECEEPRCAEGLPEAWSALADADNACNGHWLGPGNTKYRVLGGCWVVPGIPPSQYHPSTTRMSGLVHCRHGARATRNMHI